MTAASVTDRLLALEERMRGGSGANVVWADELAAVTRLAELYGLKPTEYTVCWSCGKGRTGCLPSHEYRNLFPRDDGNYSLEARDGR